MFSLLFVVDQSIRSENAMLNSVIFSLLVTRHLTTPAGTKLCSQSVYEISSVLKATTHKYNHFVLIFFTRFNTSSSYTEVVTIVFAQFTYRQHVSVTGTHPFGKHQIFPGPHLRGARVNRCPGTAH